MLDHPMIREELIRLRMSDRLDGARNDHLATHAAEADPRSSRLARLRSFAVRSVESEGVLQRRHGRMLRWIGGAVAS
jgi:hypothetical protein